MNSFTKMARLHRILFKQASNDQFVAQKGAPAAKATGPRAGGASAGSIAGRASPFQGFAPKSQQAPLRSSIHSPSPEQQKINAAFAKQKEDAGFNTRVEDLRSGGSGPYSGVPGMSAKQQEMGNYKSYSQGWRQDNLNPLATKGVKGEAIRRDLKDDELVSTVAGMVLPTSYALSGLAAGGGLMSNLEHGGGLAYQGAKLALPAALSGSSSSIPK